MIDRDKSDIDLHLKQVGRRLRSLRKHSNLRIADLSLMTGLTSASISHIERGHRDVRISTLLVLARALKIEPWQLFFDIRDKNEEN